MTTSTERTCPLCGVPLWVGPSVEGVCDQCAYDEAETPRMTAPADLEPGQVAKLPIATGVVRGVERHEALGLTSVTLEVVLWDHDVCEAIA